jgi:myosin heavy subunit
VGLTKAKKDLLALEEQEIRLLAERQLLEEEREKGETRARWAQKQEGEAASPQGAARDGPRRVLLRETEDAVDTIIKLAAKSSNLKWTFQKMLKGAAKIIAAAAEEFAALSSTKEMASLESENRELKEEVTSIRRELQALKEEVRRGRRVAAKRVSSNTDSDMEVEETSSPLPPRSTP